MYKACKYPIAGFIHFDESLNHLLFLRLKREMLAIRIEFGVNRLIAVAQQSISFSFLAF